MVTQNAYEFEISDVPLDTDGTYTVGGVGEGSVFYPERLEVRFTEDITGLLPVCSLSAGTNSPSFDNIVAGIGLGTVAAPSHRAFAPIALSGVIPGIAGPPGGVEVKLRVNYTSGVGGKANVSLIGFMGP